MNYFDGIIFMYCGEYPRHNCPEKNRYFPGYYGLQYNHAGPLYFAKGDNPPVDIEGSYAFVTHPDMKFQYGAPEGKTRHHIFVSFKGPKVEKFIRSGLLEIDSQQPLIRISNPERFQNTFLELIKQINTNLHENYPRAVLLLEDLLLQLQEQTSEKTEINSHLLPYMKKLGASMEQEPHMEWDFTREAASIGISYPHFRRTFRQFTGTAPLNYLIRCRLRRASYMLLHSNEQISSVAEKCGMSDVFYFSRLFKKYYSLPPLTYRREFRNRK